MTDSTALVFDEIRARLRDQSAQLETIRNRAGSVTAVGVVAVSFLGGTVLDRQEDPTAVTWVGLALFGASVVASLVVLLPVKGWLFNPDPRLLLEDFIDLEEVESQRQLAEYMASWVTPNHDRLTALQVTVSRSVLLTLAAIVLLLYEMGHLAG